MKGILIGLIALRLAGPAPVEDRSIPGDGKASRRLGTEASAVPPAATRVRPAGKPEGTDDSYRVGPKDVLLIEVWNQADVEYRERNTPSSRRAPSPCRCSRT